MAFLSNKHTELCHVPYQKSTWSHCVICPGRAKSPTYFPLKSILFSWHWWWTFQLGTPQQPCKLLPPRQNLLFSWVRLLALLCVCVYLYVCIRVWYVFEGVHRVQAGNSWAGGYWTGCHSTWKIWRHQLSTRGKRTASPQLSSISDLIASEANVEEPGFLRPPIASSAIKCGNEGYHSRRQSQERDDTTMEKSKRQMTMFCRKNGVLSEGVNGQFVDKKFSLWKNHLRLCKLYTTLKPFETYFCRGGWSTPHVLFDLSSPQRMNTGHSSKSLES